LAAADVGQPAPDIRVAWDMDLEHQVVELRTPIAVRPGKLGGEQVHPVAERPQQRREEPVQLVAEAASPLPDDLGEDSIGFQPDRATEKDVEVLEWDRLQMGQGERAQRLDRRRGRAVVADPFEIAVRIHVVHGEVPLRPASGRRA